MRSASLFFILSTQSSADVPTTHRVVTSILAFCAVSMTYFTKSSHLAFSEVDLTHHLKLIGAKKKQKNYNFKKNSYAQSTINVLKWDISIGSTELQHPDKINVKKGYIMFIMVSKGINLKCMWLQ